MILPEVKLILSVSSPNIISARVDGFARKYNMISSVWLERKNNTENFITIFSVSFYCSSETTLWTNASPTSNFNAQTITLADNISRYKYLKFVYNHKTTLPDRIFSSLVESTVIIRSSSSTGQLFMAIGCIPTGGGARFREITYVNDNQLSVSPAYMTGSGSSDTNHLILIEVLGVV